MGQAKKRGSKADRVALAQQKATSMRPEYIICNHCKAEIYNLHAMDCHDILGLDGAFCAICQCGHETWAFSGTQNAIAAITDAMKTKKTAQVAWQSLSTVTA